MEKLYFSRALIKHVVLFTEDYYEPCATCLTMAQQNCIASWQCARPVGLGISKILS